MCVKTYNAGRCWNVLLYVLFILFIIAKCTIPIYSDFVNNIGWLKLTNAYQRFESSDQWLYQVLPYFDVATNVDKSNRRAWLGRGIVHTLLNDEDKAYLDWQYASAHPALLVGMGKVARNKKQEDIALTYYQGAINSISDYQDAVIEISQVCQEIFSKSEILQPHHQQYCLDFFESRGGNILPNGNFDEEYIGGWNGWESLSNGQFSWEFDETSGYPAPSLMFNGTCLGTSCGIYQFVALKPGERIRLSGWFKVDSDNIEARVLYVDWHQNNMPQGNQLQIISNSMNWTYLEREFQLPDNAEPRIVFYPIVLSGAGEVWLDNIKVEMLP